ncbi:MAG: LPXTG cell wall anchor domain-containing protein [Bacteroidaceae bacterium]|nr:LPXTG cell wall anchor domain-containing protein [Bacteroidaceae bacterium]
MLNGAEFGLYKLSGGKYLSVQSFTTGDDGHITFQNLEVDTVYKLMEEKAPDGYAIITKDILFGLKPDDRTNTVSLVFYDQLGNIVSAPEGVTGKYLSAGRLLTFTVKNLRGYELPATGGMGGIIYILFGAALVTAPFVYIFSLRRKYERRLKQ